MSNKIHIDDLEVNDIVYVDKSHGFCTVKNIAVGIKSNLIVEFEGCELYIYKGVFIKRYTKRKQFKLFE